MAELCSKSGNRVTTLRLTGALAGVLALGACTSTVGEQELVRATNPATVGIKESPQPATTTPPSRTITKTPKPVLPLSTPTTLHTPKFPAEFAADCDIARGVCTAKLAGTFILKSHGSYAKMQHLEVGERFDFKRLNSQDDCRTDSVLYRNDRQPYVNGVVAIIDTCSTHPSHLPFDPSKDPLQATPY